MKPITSDQYPLPAKRPRNPVTNKDKVQRVFGVEMPLVRHVEGGIWEVRTRLATRIARVLFVLEGGTMVLLHGFIKKDRKTPKPDLDLARQRLKRLRSMQ